MLSKLRWGILIVVAVIAVLLRIISGRNVL